MSKRHQKIIVVGSGIAGLTCALDLAEFGHEVVIITKAKTSDSATFYAQGGIATQLFNDIDDSADSHIEDTLKAGNFLGKRDAISLLVNSSNDAIEKLISRGAHFDKVLSGAFDRTIEGGHSVARIIHSGGDKTGQEVEVALVNSLNKSKLLNISVIDFSFTNSLLVNDDRCVGVSYLDSDGNVHSLEADHVVLASGGAGQLYSVTTNPLLATGDGVALALSNSVICSDLEFMQFHPTALHVNNMPRPLISEALRGAGAVLRDIHGVEFMKGVHELADLAPRDVVSREIFKSIKQTQHECVFLDATKIDSISDRFPTIYKSCIEIGIDPRIDMLPVSPAAHYYCGGITTDLDGATSMANLWAIGEVACNGVHGANRLASNSLLDGLVFGSRVASAIDEQKSNFENSAMFANFNEAIEIGENSNDVELHVGEIVNSDVRSELQKLMNQNAGIIRNQESLESLTYSFKSLADHSKEEPPAMINEFEKHELRSLFVVAQALVKSALNRKESRGCHSRSDFDAVDEFYFGNIYHCGSDKPLLFAKN